MIACRVFWLQMPGYPFGSRPLYAPAGFGPAIHRAFFRLAFFGCPCLPPDDRFPQWPPTSYRELAYVVPSGTPEKAVERLIRACFLQVLGDLRDAPSGRGNCPASGRFPRPEWFLFETP